MRSFSSACRWEGHSVAAADWINGQLVVRNLPAMIFWEMATMSITGIHLRCSINLVLCKPKHANLLCLLTLLEVISTAVVGLSKRTVSEFVPAMTMAE